MGTTGVCDPIDETGVRAGNGIGDGIAERRS
jgi:hypothetical protein